MNPKRLLDENAQWLTSEGPYSDIVISSRVRLARNVSSIPFKYWASPDQERQLITLVKDACHASSYFKGSLFFNLLGLTRTERYFLLERHLISKEHAEYKGERALSVTHGETLSVMINEEDHLRIQSLFPGFQVMEAWRLADKIDSEFEHRLDYAFSNQYGYLTACPTNVGTGMRASIMIHLPCLVLTKQINDILESISKLGLAVRGLYGEGTAATGDFFQISNQVTLGLSEEDIIDNIEKICRQILEHEISARDRLYQKEKIRLEDRVWRAYGLLKSARIINYNETIQLLSALRLGKSLDFLDITREQLNDIFLYTQPSHLQFIEKKKLIPFERDIKRADLIRKTLQTG